MMKKTFAILLTTLLMLALFVPAHAEASVAIPTAAATTTPAAITLRRGSRSNAVLDLQTKLIELCYLKSRADGVFGPKTEQAVRDFQLAHALTENGIFDADDFEQLASPTVKKRASSGIYDNTPGSSSSTSSGSKTTAKSTKKTYNTTHNTPNSPHTPDNTPNTPDNSRDSR